MVRLRRLRLPEDVLDRYAQVDLRAGAGPAENFEHSADHARTVLHQPKSERTAALRALLESASVVADDHQKLARLDSQRDLDVRALAVRQGIANRLPCNAVEMVRREIADYRVVEFRIDANLHLPASVAILA